MNEFDNALILNVQQCVCLFGSILSQRELQPYEALMYKSACELITKFYGTFIFEENDEEDPSGFPEEN